MWLSKIFFDQFKIHYLPLFLIHSIRTIIILSTVIATAFEYTHRHTVETFIQNNFKIVFSRKNIIVK